MGAGLMLYWKVGIMENEERLLKLLDARSGKEILIVHSRPLRKPFSIN